MHVKNERLGGAKGVTKETETTVTEDSKSETSFKRFAFSIHQREITRSPKPYYLLHALIAQLAAALPPEKAKAIIDTDSYKCLTDQFKALYSPLPYVVIIYGRDWDALFQKRCSYDLSNP